MSVPTSQVISPLKVSEFHGVRSPKLVEKTIGQYLDEVAAMYPDQLAVVVHHQHIRWITVNISLKSRRSPQDY